MLAQKIDGPVFVCAGEPSGDLYASFLIRDLKTRNTGLKVFAIGGKHMLASGADMLLSYDKMMTFGFKSGILSSWHHYSIYKKIARLFYRTRSRTFIAVAYPGLNLLLCKYAKHNRCKVYYFLPPQIWAWGTFRKYFIKKWVDSVISVFPFEHKFYRRMRIRTLLFENPLFKALEKYRRRDLRKKIGFMPGSRSGEIKRNLPVITELAETIKGHSDDINFVYIIHPDLLGLASDIITKKMLGRVPNYRITSEDRYQAMKDCDLLIICSGTASLEAAVLGVPQIFFNRPSSTDYYLFKRFLKIKEYNLTNLYFGEKNVESFISVKKDDLVKKVFHYFRETFLIDE